MRTWSLLDQSVMTFLCVLHLLLVVCAGVQAEMLYKMRDGVGLLSSDESSSETRSSHSARHCAHLCHSSALCRAANYNHGACELIMADLLEFTESRVGNVAITDTQCLPNPCQNGGVCTFDVDGAYACGCVGNYVGRHCEKLYVLTLRTDDEGAVYSKGQVLHDTFVISGGQHSVTYTITLNTDVLVLKHWNGPGPGTVVATVNGVSVSGWRCVVFSDTQDPRAVYPGCSYPDYDDRGLDQTSTNFAQLCRAKLTM